MVGKAVLEIPRRGNIGPDRIEGFSDVLAMSYGTLFASTFSKPEEFVRVTLSDGKVKTIGPGAAIGTVIIGD